MTKPPKWDRHSILGELRRRGMTLTELAKRNDMSPGGFRTIWTRPNSKSEAVIAEFLGIAAETLFPDRYPKRTARILSHEYTSESSKPHRDAA